MNVRTIAWTLLAAIVSIAAVYTALRRLPSPAIVRHREEVASSLLLDRVIDIAELQTVAGVTKVVFPHDFYRQNRSVAEILDALESDGDAPGDAERIHLEAYGIARSTGLALERTDTEFVVLTAIVVAGYDLSSYHGDRLSPGTFVLPEATILDVRIEDLQPDTYAYPAIRLTPDELRRVAVFVERNVPSLPVTAEIVRTAREQAVGVLSTLFGGHFDGEVLAIP